MPPMGSCAFASANLVDARGEVFFFGGDNVVGTGGQEFGLLLRGAGSGDANGAFGLRNLNRCDAYAAAGGSDQDEIALSDLAVHHERPVCGEILHPDGGAFLVGEAGGVFGYSGDGDDGYFAVDTVGVCREGGDSTGDFAEPTLVNARADGFDGA